MRSTLLLFFLLAIVAAAMAQTPAPANNPIMREAPTNWTMDARYYERFIEVPKAKDCLYWGAAAFGKHCDAYLILASSPKHLKCRTDSNYTNVVHCIWDKPQPAKPEELR